MTIHRGGEGQRVGCRACDVVFRDRTPGDLALVPCPVCGPRGRGDQPPHAGHVAQRLCGRGGSAKLNARMLLVKIPGCSRSGGVAARPDRRPQTSCLGRGA
jgi:hypothetical protein